MKQLTPKAMHGKKVRFVYATETYRIEILDGRRLHWECERGQSAGKTGDEEYVFSQLGDGLAMFTWIEADGLGLSNVLDPAAGTVTTHGNQGRKVFENRGRLEIG